MVKKGTKRKTRWRTLSIGDGGTDTSDTGITEIKQEQSECLTSTSNTNLSTYSRKSSALTAPFHQRNGDRNHYFRSSYKYPSSQPHTRTPSRDESLHQQTSYPFKRRPLYQSSSYRYFGNNVNNKTNPTTNNNYNNRPYRSADTFDNKENNTTKPLFNEDDYTRITTPRQDVLFKKGYLSRPKKTITPIDTAASSSTTVSVVSTEDSISSGTQSLSPEHGSSTPEVFDLDHPLMYPGFYDQNGLFYANPFMPNGFDPYDGQMFMMPYGGSPFSINPSEYCNSESTAPYPQNLYQKRNSVDSENSPESPSSLNESASASASSTPAIDDTSNEPSQNGDAPMESPIESDGPKAEGEVTPNECNHLPMQFYYPFMYGPPPFLPIDEMEYNDNMAPSVNSYGGKYNRFRKRKRRPFKWVNSTGVSATTTDYSEDEDSVEENNSLPNPTGQQKTFKPSLTIAQCDEVISRTTLNTNVSEFVPRHLQSSPSRTTLNVEVEEFHPRNYTPATTAAPSKSDVDPDTSSKETVTKQMSPEPRKVTILHRSATEKYTQPTQTPPPPSKMGNQNKPEQNLNVRVTSAIDKSSTLISSISSRDKNDDNVNGVDNNKKIEKLVDPVNVKADLDDKVVMHPKQQENILENVRNTKFKNTKFNSKSSPRKSTTTNKPKKDAKVGKGAITTNGKRENVVAVVAMSEQSLPLESKANDVENRNGVDEKPSQLTYAQMLGPTAKPKAIHAKPKVVSPIQEHVEPPPAEEAKSSEIVDEVKPAMKVETKWQTVRPKGRKKLFSVQCDEPDDKWDDFDEEEPIVAKEINEVTVTASQEIQIDEPNVAADDVTTESTLATPAKVKPPKTEKVKLKLKAKKSQKKIKEKVNKSSGASESESAEPNGTSTPKNEKMKSNPATPIIDDLLADGGHEFLKDIDISNFNFETSQSMFVNAITNSGIYTDSAMTGKPTAGFALNNSLKLLNNTFDFCKTKENALLREEEEMVIQVLKSLNYTDSQIVKEDDDVARCINIIENVKLNDERCDDVEIDKPIVDVVNGHNGTHDDGAEDDTKNETVGAEEMLIVNDEMNENAHGMHEDAEKEEMNEETKEIEYLPTNGHGIEDIIIPDGRLDEADQMESNSKIEQLSNGDHADEAVEDDTQGETVGAEILIVNDEMNGNGGTKDTNGHQNEDIEQVDQNEDIEQVDQNGTIPKFNPISNGNHSIDELKLNGDVNGSEIDVSAQSVRGGDVAMSIDDKNDLDVTANIAETIETEKLDGITDELLVEGEYEKEVEEIHKDCTTSNIKSDDEGHSDLSELSDENDETIVYFEHDEIETIREIDVTEFVDDLQFDDDIDDLVLSDENEMNIRNGDSELNTQDEVMMQDCSPENEQEPRPPSPNIFIGTETDDISKTEITLADIEEAKNQDRIQSPRSSEDSGILESHDDGRYFSESDNDKTEQISTQSFPLTQAVSRWLEAKQKEKSPEPIIRLPNDPELSQRIEKSILNGMHISDYFDDYEDEETSDESETEYEAPTASKNLISNPLRALFRRNNATTTASSNGVRKRVANQKLESDKSSITADEPDILEYWENDPMLQTTENSNVLNDDEQQNTDLAAYESVYGKTIDYAKLSANIRNDDVVFLSNNILNNDKLSKLPNNNNPINNNTDNSLLPASSINGNKIDANSNDKNLNCFKPPEICCMLM